MQKLKKQKIQEMLDAQNAAIEADMVGVHRMPFLIYDIVYWFDCQLSNSYL